MRRQSSLLAFFIFASTTTFSQRSETINNQNYYQFQTQGASINWLRANDAVPIIIDELLKNGIGYHTISIGDLVKINDSTRLVVTVMFDKGKEYGFLYEPTHGIPLNPKDRDFLNSQKQGAYVQAEKDTKDQVHFMRIEPIPQNIFLLKQTVYWFQFDNMGSKFSVSKQVAEDILRQDIRKYLKSIRSV